MRTIPFLLVALLLAACEAGGAGEEIPATGREEFGPTAAYDRRLVFLGPGAELPTAAVFDFAVLSDSAGLRRGIRARLVDGMEWIPLMDAGWEMARMREPWRLVPHGDLKLIVGSAGELDALVFAGEELGVRLDPGSSIAEYSPDAGTQLVLRQAELRLGGEPVTGILLDAQLGRAVNPAAIPRIAPEPADPGAEDAGEIAADAAGDSLLVDPAPAARPGAEALLLDNAGYYVVFAASAEGDMAWVHAAGRDDVRRPARLEPFEWEPFQEAGVQVPTAWRVLTPGDLFGGEIRAEAADRAVIGEGAATGAMGYVVVTGWIEDRGVRRNVYGMVRHVR